MLDARLIGFQAKFFLNVYSNTTPGELGLITDSGSCEEGAFTNLNIFINMVVDISTGVTVS